MTALAPVAMASTVTFLANAMQLVVYHSNFDRLRLLELAFAQEVT